MSFGNQKYFAFGTEISYLGSFTIFIIFYHIFIIFKISTFEVSCKKGFKFWDQHCLVWIFCVVILRIYSHIWNEHPGICQNARFSLNIKILKFGTKKGFFFLEFLGWDLNSIVWNHHFRINQTGKFCLKKKKSKFGNKYGLFVCFFVAILKKSSSFLKPGSSNLSITNTTNLGVGSVFTIAPASPFSEGRDADQGPLYNIYHLTAVQRCHICRR